MDEIAKLLLGLKSDIYQGYLKILNDNYGDGIIEIKPRKGEMIIKNNHATYNIMLPLYGETRKELNRLNTEKQELLLKYNVMREKLIFMDKDKMDSVIDQYDYLVKQLKSIDEEITKYTIYEKIANQEFAKEVNRLRDMKEVLYKKLQKADLSSKTKVSMLEEIKTLDESIMNEQEKFVDYFLKKMPEVDEVRRVKEEGEGKKKVVAKKKKVVEEDVDEEAIKEMVKTKIKRVAKPKKKE
jgi:hypothetical protein